MHAAAPRRTRRRARFVKLRARLRRRISLNLPARARASFDHALSAPPGASRALPLPDTKRIPDALPAPSVPAPPRPRGGAWRAPERRSRRISARYSIRAAPAAYDGDAASFYSHASVVDVSDVALPAALPPPPPPLPAPARPRADAPARKETLAERAAAAAAEALDLKPSRAGRALAALPLLHALLTEREAVVGAWLLRAAGARTVRAAAAELIAAGVLDAAPPPARARAAALVPAGRPPPDEALRRVALEVGYAGPAWGARYAREWTGSGRVRRARARAARAAVLPLSFALGLVATVCALARLECAFARRPFGGHGSRAPAAALPRAVLAARCGAVRFSVAVVGTAPCSVLFTGPRFAGKAAVQEFDDIAAEAAEVVAEFADAVVYA